MRGKLIGSFVVVNKNPISLRYVQKLIGEVRDNKVFFNLYEAKYLIEKGVLSVFENDKELTPEEFDEKAKRIDEKFLEKYLVYKDLKERGYYVGAGLKFGSDFRVYEKGFVPRKKRTEWGEPGHSKWVVWVFRQGERITTEKLASVVRTAHSTRKKVLLAIVDIEGDVTYYELDWKRM